MYFEKIQVLASPWIGRVTENGPVNMSVLELELDVTYVSLAFNVVSRNIVTDGVVSR